MYPVRPVGPADDSPGRNPGPVEDSPGETPARWRIARGETLGFRGCNPVQAAPSPGAGGMTGQRPPPYINSERGHRDCIPYPRYVQAYVE